MGILTILGKILLIAALGFQANQLFQDKSTINSFNLKLIVEMQRCDCLSEEIKILIVGYLRLVVVGLLASSVFFLVVRHWIFKLTTLIGLLVLLWLDHFSGLTLTKFNINLLNNAALWNSLGLIGALLLLMGLDCTPCEVKTVKTKTEAIRETVNRRYEALLKSKKA